MNTDQIKTLRDVFLPEVENEFRTTLGVIAATPDAKQDYAPAPNSMTAIDLAWHIASSDVWFLQAIIDGKFSGSDDGARPKELKNVSDIKAWYQKSFPELFEKVKGLSLEALSRELDFFGVLKLPAVQFLGVLRNHSIHHRGQLSTYLRPMGAKVPKIYGGSFDEPMKM